MYIMIAKQNVGWADVRTDLMGDQGIPRALSKASAGAERRL